MTTSLSERVLRGDRVAVSRAITILENHGPGSADLMKDIYPHTGNAFVIGVTGPPGTGKSTLVDRLLKIYRSKGSRVAVLAVDPSSPLSGGAMLGDRVRMVDHTLDSDVFIRSMASRGDEGGLAKAARNAIRVLDAAGNEVLMVETVGIGQAEFEIVKVADAIVVVLMPELGDEIQAFKAGMIEFGDIFVVNKSDLPGAERVVYNLQQVLTTVSSFWNQTVVKASAKTGEGLDELHGKLELFRSEFRNSKEAGAVRSKRIFEELIEGVSSTFVEKLVSRLTYDSYFQELAKKVQDRRLDPDTATAMLVRRMSGKTMHSSDSQ